MTTKTATVLPRREPPSGASAPTQSSLPVLGGYASDGEPAAAVFFWGATRFRDDFEYAIHRHEGLEILTLVLQGTMSHYDEATGEWAYLNTDDAQMMRSGSGVSHIERGARGTRGFQIQFDPGYEVALGQEPSYTDYRAASFTAHLAGDAFATELVGNGGPIEARTEGLSVRRVAVPFGSRAELGVGPGRFTLAYLIDGAATVNGASAVGDDVISLAGADTLTADATAPADLLVVSVPASPSYEPRRLDTRELAGRGAPGGPAGFSRGRGGFPGGPR
jgi:quercetin 2,3-dioxygenase